MKAFALSALFAVALLAGCSQPPAETASDTGAPASTAAATEPGKKDTMAKCAECNAELPGSELVSHDGKMLCKKCVDSHGH